jgi:hypothetical protein
MVARHDILRTCVVATDDAQRPIVQVVLSQWQAPWNEFNALQSSIDDCISRHAQLVSNAVDSMEAAVSFATITREDKVYLSFVCHHALYDGVGIEKLLHEVEQQFLGSPLPPAPTYHQFLRQSLALPGRTDSFWVEKLADYEPKLTTHLTSRHVEARCFGQSIELDIPLSEVRANIRELGVSLLALTQSAWATALGGLFNTDDICFGNVVSGRSLPIESINDLVAPCFNTIPLRMDMSRKRRNLDVMKALQSANAELMQYQFTPLRRIHSLVSQHGNRRLFDTLLLLQQSPRPLDRSIWTLERDDGEMDVSLLDTDAVSSYRANGDRFLLFAK